MTSDQLRAAGWVPHNEACNDLAGWPDELQVLWAIPDTDYVEPRSSVMENCRSCRGTYGDQHGARIWLKPFPPIGLLSDQLPPLICAEVLPARYRSREEREAEWRARR